MPTNMIVHKTTEQYMSGYTPIYSPIYPLFLGRAVQYAAEVGVMNFKEVKAVGDIRQKRITPKDTEIKQISVTDSSKSYKKYYFGNQFIVSDLQDQSAAQDVVQQVLDEHQLQMDELVMTGDGTSTADLKNNGLFFSLDENYVLENSYEVPTTDRLLSFHNKIVEKANKADAVAGRKAIIFYGSNAIGLFDSLYSATTTPFKTVLAQVLGNNYSYIKAPEESTPAGASGFIVVNLDQVRMHYTLLPSLDAQGNNEEKGYAWFNFKMGSVMIEVTQSRGVIRQPITLAV